ncbi:hypothetical protein [Piscirickettsia salmonis]|uniref:hypothetical protein n=2 Tax=Piscirickettsia salmonis TaxID=1238 RepID=UPI0006BD1F6F|nr:hypothetical protein [Piscirickettsia salmonis]ALA24246.1 kinase domain protein [Piscirickettsia salmonis]QGO81316.1 hypothetical protein Psal107_02342 [Piscirickettsia salmonis]QGP23190.1 hypothetical protein Psal158_02340 [Piscirickettsia salmonis]QGP26573.1 hypothetical protein Psal159_02341 [Piscirickettsia salmonis]QGP29954.1 hypothetical protein Psal160_02339 [Piscirickettsia salmonis]
MSTEPSIDDKNKIESLTKDFCSALVISPNLIKGLTKGKYYKIVEALDVAVEELKVLAEQPLLDLYKSHYLKKHSVTSLDVKFAQIDSVFSSQVKWGLAIKKDSEQKRQAEKIGQELKALSTAIVRSFEENSTAFYRKYRWAEITKLKLSEKYIDKVVANPGQFRENYCRLEELGPHEQAKEEPGLHKKVKKELGLHEKASIVQQVLDDPVFFERVYLTLDLGVADLSDLRSYIEKALTDPELFTKAYKYLKEFGLHQFKYINLLLNDFEGFKKNCEYLADFQSGRFAPYTKEIIVNSALFTQGYECLKALELNQPENIDKLLGGLALFAGNYQRLEKLGFSLNPERVKKMLDNLESFDQDYPSLQKLHAVYDGLTAKIENNQLKVHGLTGGSSIMFKGQLRCVPKGVSKIWEQVADDEGNFKWMDDADVALTQAKAQADQRQGFRGLTAVSMFFGSYRDSETKELYKEISGLLAS